MSDELVAVVYNGPIAVADVRLPDGTTATFERDGDPVELTKKAADHVLTNTDFALAKPTKTPALRAGTEA